jgi:Transposase DDE domain
MVQGRFFRKVAELRSQYDQSPALPFAEVLGESRLHSLLAELKIFFRDRIYNPCVTLWTFLSQVLSPDHSCRAAVARLLAFRTAAKQTPCSADTASYCQARQRLPVELVSRLVRDSGKELHGQVPACWHSHSHGRPVKMVDGSTASMPDTPSNADEFGKPGNQKGGGIFPLLRLVVVLCLATGSVLEAALGKYRGKGTGELSLFRSLNDPFAPGDILLGDRLFCTYFDLARLRHKQVDAVFALHGRRKADFRRGKRLGKDDHVVTWTKPRGRPEWLSEEEFAAMPADMKLREVRVRVPTKGFRVKKFVVVTTLTDADSFSKDDIAALYRQRWQAELDLRSIKSVMQMDVLRCQTPDMVRKEVWIHLLAYNLLRSVMCAAAEEEGLEVRQLSFKGTMQLLDAFYQMIVTAAPQDLDSLCTTLLKAVKQHGVGHRPDRYEPRKRKRAAKAYPPLKLPRDKERKLCTRKRLG